MDRLQKSWVEYLNAVFPNGTAPEQFSQNRMSFFGGAWAMFTLLADVPESNAEQYICDLKRECAEFCRDVKAGRK